MPEPPSACPRSPWAFPSSVIHAALIPAVIAASRAAWLLLTGETIEAGTAASWGLVHDVVPDDELDASGNWRPGWQLWVLMRYGTSLLN